MKAGHGHFGQYIRIERQYIKIYRTVYNYHPSVVHSYFPGYLSTQLRDSLKTSKQLHLETEFRTERNHQQKRDIMTIVIAKYCIKNDHTVITVSHLKQCLKRAYSETSRIIIYTFDRITKILTTTTTVDILRNRVILTFNRATI